MGINRNIVECKVESSCPFASSVTCINRNIVECKDALQAQLANCCCVLIETLWNVKIMQRFMTEFWKVY